MADSVPTAIRRPLDNSALAFVGVVLAMAPGTGAQANAANLLAGDLLGLMAGASWAATTLVFGVTFGALLLGEPLTVSFLLGGFAIIGGVVLVSR